jgi:hypothetical protein
MNIPENILKDIELTGWTIQSHNTHNVSQLILNLKLTRDIDWSMKDFSRFSWCESANYTSSSDKYGKIKVKKEFSH